MTFRRRITLVSATAVAVAIALASILVYILTSQQLHRQVDAAAARPQPHRRLPAQPRAEDTTRCGRGALRPPAPRAGAFATATGSGAPAPFAVERDDAAGIRGPVPHPHPGARRGARLPAGHQRERQGRSPARSSPRRCRSRPAATALAAHGGNPFFSTATVAGTHLRVLAEAAGSGRAVLARPAAHRRRSPARPNAPDPGRDRRRRDRARRAARHVRRRGGAGPDQASDRGRASTYPDARPVAADHTDERGRDRPPGRSFNAMLDALEGSMRRSTSVTAQRQLVADASHELRTPVTSGERTSRSSCRCATWNPASAGECCTTSSSRSRS